MVGEAISRNEGVGRAASRGRNRVTTLTPADEALFFYWINERHMVALHKDLGVMKPWTQDEILQSYKFTNVFRQKDRGTVWLTNEFLHPHRDADAPLLVFNIGWYRLFNWTGTGRLIGWQESWSKARVKTKLKKAEARGDQVFTGAHIVWGEKGLPKIEGVLLSCRWEEPTSELET